MNQPNQPMNQTNQPNQPINQLNKPMNQPNQSMNQPSNQPSNQPTIQVVCAESRQLPLLLQNGAGKQIGHSIIFLQLKDFSF